ncbi:carboxypeptidase A2-like [Phymastichus coffea]|uniref:carboxypeptidase A2-like n=1 Tax=Phymastichus coffea TaxID=108790 RepID=UPI00273B39C1|nr:carboxypeptidase A2-like [Phymastichus coffea]
MAKLAGLATRLCSAHLILLLARAEPIDIASSISRNLSGFLLSRDGKFYVQPVLANRSLSTGIRDEQHKEFETRSAVSEGESWSKIDEDGAETSTTGVELKVTKTQENESSAEENHEDDGISWEPTPKSWWRRIVGARSRTRAFSFYGIVESAFTGITKFIGSIIGDDDNDDEADYQYNGVNYQGYQLLRIIPKNLKQVEHLKKLRDSEPDDVKFWTTPVKNRVTDIVISPAMQNDVKVFLRQKKIDFILLTNDLQKFIKSENPRMPKERRQDLFSLQGHSMTWKRYHRYKDVMGYLDYLAEKYPQLVEVMSIGESFEGRALKVVKVSTGADKNGESKPSIWIDAGMHAREWISTAVATYILNQLVEKSDNYSRLLDVTDWIVMPVANPDGYEFTHTNDRLWRKTRSIHDTDADDDEDEARQGPGILHMLTHYTKWLFGSCEGVDPNRNFNIHWGEDKVGGASTDPCHDTYAGPEPFSEPETKAISDYIMENRQTIRTYLTLHSYSQMLLVPWGFTRSKPPDFDDLMNIANKAKKAIAKVSGTEYKVGPAAELLYPTTGSSDDWAKAIAGVKNAFTMELRDRGRYGFLLPAAQIIPTARETWAGVRVIARMAATSSKT